jgi:hypothetical protein
MNKRALDASHAPVKNGQKKPQGSISQGAFFINGIARFLPPPSPLPLGGGAAQWYFPIISSHKK